MKNLILLFILGLFIGIVLIYTVRPTLAAIALINIVSSTHDGVSAGNLSATITTTSTATLIAACSIYGNNTSISGIGDGTNTYVTSTIQAGPAAGSVFAHGVFTSASVPSGTYTVNCTGTTSTGWLLFVSAYTGLSTTIDASSTSSSTAANNTVGDPGAITTSNANDLVYAFGGTQTSACTLSSVAPGYKKEADSFPSGCSRINGVTYDQILTNTTTTDATDTYSGITPWWADSVAFKASVAATTTTASPYNVFSWITDD